MKTLEELKEQFIYENATKSNFIAPTKKQIEEFENNNNIELSEKRSDKVSVTLITLNEMPCMFVIQNINEGCEDHVDKTNYMFEEYLNQFNNFNK